jgi:hypothetical protein
MLVSALHEALRKPAVVPTFSAATLDATRAGEGVESGAAEQHALFQEPVAAYVASRFGRVLGQVQDTFIVSTTEDEVFFLDQHVVHERVVFEQVRGQLAAGPLPSQSLLFPETLDLGPAARALLERWREPLERLGFGFEGFGGDAVVLRAVPTLLKGDEPKRLIEGGRARARPGAGLRGVPGGGEGQHPAGARGDGAPGHRPRPHRDALLLPAWPAHREPRVHAGHPSRAQAHVVIGMLPGGVHFLL